MASKFQFNRDYTLYIGEPDKQGVVIKDLQITFDVEQVIDTKLEVGKAKIRIWNLSKETYNKLQIPQNYVRLLAGYKESGMAEVLLGNTTDVRTEREGQDFITTIYVGEAYAILNNVRVTSLIPSGKTVGDVILEIAKKAKLNQGTFSGEGIKKTLMYGYPVSGTVKSQLDEICAAYKLFYVIKGNTISVGDVGMPLLPDKVEAFHFNKGSGLIGIPSYREYNYGTIKEEVLSTDQKVKKKNVPLKKQGIQFTALLNPRVKPGSTVVIDSDVGAVPQGSYMVVKVSYKGDFRGNDWCMDVLCDKVDYSGFNSTNLNQLGGGQLQA